MLNINVGRELFGDKKLSGPLLSILASKIPKIKQQCSES